MRVNRFVFDTNIWVSYFITRSEHKLISIIVENNLTVFSCNELLDEISSVLAYPHLKKYNVDIRTATRTLKNATTHSHLSYPIKRYIPDDENDNYLIALALQTNSGFVTSGDVHILSQKENLEKRFSKLKIITKAEFEQKFLNN
jgi:uncharacterized protein